GVQDAGQIGEVIKDIVKDIVIDPKDTTETTTTGSGLITTTEMDPSLSTLFETTITPSFSTAKSSTPANRYPVYIASKNSPKYLGGRSDSNSRKEVIFSTQSDGSGEPEPSVSTRYVTSVDKSVRTLTLTSTKVSVLIVI